MCIRDRHPFVAKLIENIHLSTEEISSLLDDVSQNEYNEKEGAEKWVKEHQELVDSWIPRNRNISLTLRAAPKVSEKDVYKRQDILHLILWFSLGYEVVYSGFLCNIFGGQWVISRHHDCFYPHLA